MKPCLYMLGGINYKNGVISTCPRQGDQLVFQKDAYLPSDVFNHENFKKAREQLYNDIFPKGCKLCEEMEDIGAQSMRKDFILYNVFSTGWSFSIMIAILLAYIVQKFSHLDGLVS